MDQVLTPSPEADFGNEPTRPGGRASDDDSQDPRPVLGARLVPGGTRFGLFCTTASSCHVRLFSAAGERIADHALEPGPEGHFGVGIPGVGPGALYKFVLDGRELPDPYARFLPQGVHGPAAVVEARHRWRHPAAPRRRLREHVIYELHVGTFTEAGTYAAAAERLPELARLGVTAVELLPVAAFPGGRGWGYDGVALYAPFAPYGSPDDLRAFVDEAHGQGLAVILDVVYNHFGPAGNYLSAYSPEYFSNTIRNAWGDAPNYAHPVMRRLVLDNARYWLGEFRFDGLRLDATHAIIDPSARHILRELADVAAAVDPAKLLIAEDERNDPGLVTEMGLAGAWADDFHHVLRVTLTGERDGYYGAYPPGAAAIAETIRKGWFYEGQTYPASGKPRGRSAAVLPAEAFVYCIQNHDQVGNRALGDRVTELVSIDAYCTASALLLFLPMTPLLFQGQEWAASSPFQFFTDHDPELGRLVSEGRRSEFGHFKAFSDPAQRARIPDPQDDATFTRSKLRWAERGEGDHARVLALYERLLGLRRSDPVLRQADRAGLEASAVGELLLVRRRAEAGRRVLLANFGASSVPLASLADELQGLRLLLRTDGRTGVGNGIGDEVPPYTALVLAGDA